METIATLEQQILYKQGEIAVLDSKNATLEDKIRQNKFVMAAHVIQTRHQRKKLEKSLSEDRKTLEMREEELMAKRKAIEHLEGIVL
jgi:predicted GH43/DUF377 family glycosyl hydrolase